jgi:hypothetical protein
MCIYIYIYIYMKYAYILNMNILTLLTTLLILSILYMNDCVDHTPRARARAI